MLVLQIPQGVKTLNIANAVIWIEDGIVFSKPNRSDYVMQSREEMTEDFNRLKDFVGNKKICMIAETHPKAESPRKEDRDFISEQFEEIIKALAIITPNAVSRMITNLFFLFKPPAFPTKMFINVSDAKKWLEDCRKKGPGMTAVF